MVKDNLSFINSESSKGKLAVCESTSNPDIINFMEENKEDVSDIVTQYGGILLRDFNIRSVSEFNRLAGVVSPNLLDYENRSTPRTLLGGKIYTATEYPQHRSISLHSENSYTLSWPSKVIFFCVVAPEVGGETPIADIRQVYNRISKNLIDKFDKKQVKYVRNYSEGLDLSWQEVFQTESKIELEKYCAENDINFQWQDSQESNIELTTWQVCQATLSHPSSKDKVWFNQAHLFHTSALDDSDKDIISTILDKKMFPRQSLYGDDSEITNDEIKEINDAFESEKIVFKWKKGDVLILDNELMAHGREPFQGKRKIVVAMGE
ncbi:MAG: TauD/TfdA family dioxygenase [Legionellaceae bacterium]|nr:TauD/TfdA family dioxygenase [Legionellaceae bacterium]